MEMLQKTALCALVMCFSSFSVESAKINTPRVLLPWFESLNVNFTFEIIEGGCYSWSLSRDDIIEIEPLYEDSWGHCSRAARVSVSKTCVPPGSVIILAEEVNTGEILRGDVDIDNIKSLNVISTTWKLFLEEAPEAFEVIAYDDQGNKFSTLEGISFDWTIENLGNNVGDDPLVTLVRWSDTDYEAPRGIAELESKGLRSHSVLLYGQAMGDCKVTVCLGNICTDFELQVVASVVLNPATAIIAPGDTLRYRVVRARAGRLTIQDVSETLYTMKVSHTDIAVLEDTISLVRGTDLGSASVILMSGSTEVATAMLTVAEPYSIRVNIRPSTLLIRGEEFIIHCILLDKDGHALMAGDEVLIRLTVDGEANVDLLRSTENGTLTDAIANNAGKFTVTAKLYSIAGRSISYRVEGQASAVAVDPLQIVPPELNVAWTDNVLDIPLKHIGGGDEAVTWSESETAHSAFSLAPNGVITVEGMGEVGVKVQLKKYPYISAVGKVRSVEPELVQVYSSGVARVGRPHHLHVALTAIHPGTGEYYLLNVCNCASFAVSLLEGPEPHNVTSADWVQPLEGACCVLECAWAARGAALLRVARGRRGDSARVAVRAAPRVLWPRDVAMLTGVTLPVLAEGDSLVAESSDPGVAEITPRQGAPPHNYPHLQLFTLHCRRKGDAHLEVSSVAQDEKESVQFTAACASKVSRIRLDAVDSPGNCSGIWMRPGHELTIKVTLFDAIGRELLDESGPKLSWEIEPNHVGIQFRAVDRLFIETHPDYAPVPVPYKYYQVVIADEQAIGWSGTLKASTPDATAAIQARVVAPLSVDPPNVILAWEGETVPNISSITGGSGKYTVETPKGVSATVDSGMLNALVPGSGSYDLIVSDMCVDGEKRMVEVQIEEILSVEISTSRAICVNSCVPIAALVRGVSHKYARARSSVEWRTGGHVAVRGDVLCGEREGTGRVRALLGGVWSDEVEIVVFPPLRIVPERARLPGGARAQLRHEGGPPAHMAALSYAPATAQSYLQVSATGAVHTMAVGTAKIRLVAMDISDVELASAEAEIEVVPISGLRLRAGTQTLLVGAACPVWLEARALGAAALAALQPAPRVAWSVRDAASARVYTGHADDLLERSAAEGLSIRVVPLKPGVITVDVRVRNIGQVSDTRSWDSSVEILGISDIRTSIEGLSKELVSGDRISLAVGSTIRLKSLPRSNWQAIQDGVFDLTANGEVKALKPGYGVVVAQHRDERNNIYRESAIHVEVSTPHYCTVQPSNQPDESALRIVLRNSIGRELLAPNANVSSRPLPSHVQRAAESALGNELLISGLDSNGAFMEFEASVGGATVKDEVWVNGADVRSDRVFAVGGWAVCLEGVGWRAGAGVRLRAGAGATLAVLARDAAAKHVLRLDRPVNTVTVHQLPVHKMEFLAGEWPSSMVPLSITASGVTSGPLLCKEEQKYALDGVQANLPFTCRTKQPHTAEAVLDVMNEQIGCSIIPSVPITDSSETELCAEFGVHRACTKVLLLPPIHLSQTKVSLINPPAIFTIYGHPNALKHVKMTTSPGLKLEVTNQMGEINVSVKSDSSCGLGWIVVKSKLTGQEERIDVERECEVACGSLLGALLSLLRPYLPTMMTIAAVTAAFLYVQSKLQMKSPIRLPTEPPQTVLPPDSPLNRSRTWSRSPYAARGPAVPVYGDASTLPDASFSPNSTRIHSRFL